MAQYLLPRFAFRHSAKRLATRPCSLHGKAIVGPLSKALAPGNNDDWRDSAARSLFTKTSRKAPTYIQYKRTRVKCGFSPKLLSVYQRDHISWLVQGLSFPPIAPIELGQYILEPCHRRQGSIITTVTLAQAEICKLRKEEQPKLACLH